MRGHAGLVHPSIPAKLELVPSNPHAEEQLPGDGGCFTFIPGYVMSENSRTKLSFTERWMMTGRSQPLRRDAFFQGSSAAFCKGKAASSLAFIGFKSRRN